MSAKASIASYLDYADRHKEYDVSAGRKAFAEGMNVEAASETLRVVEDGVIAAAQAALEHYQAAYIRDVGPLNTSVATDTKRIEDTLRLQEQNLQQQRAANLDALDLEWGRNSPRQQSARALLNRFQGFEDTVRGEVGGRVPRYGNIVFYVLIMVCLALAEVPVNRYSFELFFGESPFLSTMIALLCGALLIYLAHAAGHILRNFGHTSSRSGPVMPIVSLTVIGLVTGALVYGIALLRQGYVDFVINESARVSFEQLLENGELTEAAAQIAANGLRADGYIFLFVNITMIAVGVIASYFYHDPHPDYERVDRGVKNSRKAIEKIEAEHAQRQAAFTKRFEQQHQGILQNIKDAESHLARLRAKLAAEMQERDADLERIRLVTRQRVLAHRQGFIAAAAQHGVTGVQTRDLHVVDSQVVVPFPQFPDVA